MYLSPIPTLPNGLPVVFASVPDSEGAHYGLVTLGNTLEVDELELDDTLPALAPAIRQLAYATGQHEARELAKSYRQDKAAWRAS